MSCDLFIQLFAGSKTFISKFGWSKEVKCGLIMSGINKTAPLIIVSLYALVMARGNKILFSK